MQGMTPAMGTQAAPAAGFPGMGKQMAPQMMDPQMGKMMQPQMMAPQMGKPMQPQFMPPGQQMGKMMPLTQQELLMMRPPMLTTTPAMRRQEQTFVENILRMNRGKVATIYATYENNPQWNAMVFTGVVENAARDHVVLSDPETGMRYIILMINIDYITFPEELRFDPRFYGE